MNDNNRNSKEQVEKESYRRIVKSTILIGSASAINVFNGVVRTKILALLLGPTGIGTIGLLTSLVATAGTVAQAGVRNVGTRQIAEACSSQDEARISMSRRSLFVSSMILAVIGGTVIWFFRDSIAQRTFGASDDEMMLAVAISVTLFVVGAGQLALIQGMRRTVDLAHLTIVGGTLTTIMGIPLLWLFGEKAIPVYIIIAPFSGAFAGMMILVFRIPRLNSSQLEYDSFIGQFIKIVYSGVPFMAASAVVAFSDLLIRIFVREGLGLIMLGQFHASWTIATQYLGFVLGAMAADYYPRLTVALSNRSEAVGLINRQSEMALILSGGAIIALFGWAPTVIAVLYSPDFFAAADLLRWLSIGTVLKVLSSPLGFVLLAAGRGVVFFVTEAITVSVMVALVYLFLPIFGLTGVGIAYLIGYTVYLPIVFLIAFKCLNFAWSPLVLKLSVAIFGILACIAAVNYINPNIASILTLCFLGVYSAYTYKSLMRLGFFTK